MSFRDCFGTGSCSVSPLRKNPVAAWSENSDPLPGSLLRPVPDCDGETTENLANRALRAYAIRQHDAVCGVWLFFVFLCQSLTTWILRGSRSGPTSWPEMVTDARNASGTGGGSRRRLSTTKNRWNPFRSLRLLMTIWSVYVPNATTKNTPKRGANHRPARGAPPPQTFRSALAFTGYGRFAHTAGKFSEGG